jgi:hypothetical protein
MKSLDFNKLLPRVTRFNYSYAEMVIGNNIQVSMPDLEECNNHFNKIQEFLSKKGISLDYVHTNRNLNLDIIVGSSIKEDLKQKIAQTLVLGFENKLKY